MPCCSCFRALLAFAPCLLLRFICFHALLLFNVRTLLLSLLCLATCACYLAVVALPSRLVVCHFKMPPTPHPPRYCFVVLLFGFMPCCSIWLVGIPSSLSCVSGRTWSNTNKLHPTIEVFHFPLNF